MVLNFLNHLPLVTTSISTTNKSNNVIPQNVEMIVNIRFNDKHTGKKISNWLKQCAKNIEHLTKTKINIKINISGEPFFLNQVIWLN